MNRKLLTLILVSLLVAFVAASCNKNPTQPPVPTATAISAPEAGKATVTGNVKSSVTDKPLGGTAVWLADVYWQDGEGAYVLDAVNSPGVYTDETGVFVFANVAAKEYVVIVGDPEGKSEVIAESNGDAKIWKIPADQIFETGELVVALGKK